MTVYACGTFRDDRLESAPGDIGFSISETHYKGPSVSLQRVPQVIRKLVLGNLQLMKIDYEVFTMATPVITEFSVELLGREVRIKNFSGFSPCLICTPVRRISWAVWLVRGCESIVLTWSCS